MDLVISILSYRFNAFGCGNPAHLPIALFTDYWRIIQFISHQKMVVWFIGPAMADNPDNGSNVISSIRQYS